MSAAQRSPEAATALRLVERVPLDARAVARMLGCTEAEAARSFDAFRQLARAAVAEARVSLLP